ncbi:LiaF transmembrane domain-containing protein [Paenibacillus plantiphilus]
MGKAVTYTMNSKSALGALLVVLGGIVVLNFIGVNLGWIIGLLMPFILIGLGVLGLKNDKKIIGGILIVVGAIMLLGKLAGIFTLLLAIGLIVWGVSVFKGARRA